MANIEEKTIVKARENAKEVEIFLKREKAYGWVIADTSTESFQNNSVEHITLQRDLSIEKNMRLKQVEDEEDEVDRAADYCDSYVYFLDSKIQELEEEKKFNPAFLIVLTVYALFQIIGATVIVFMLPKLEGVGEQFQGTLTFPEGATLFGLKEVDIPTMILVVCYGLGALIFFLCIIIIVTKVVQRKIVNAHKEYYEDKRDDFETLRDNLEEWMPDDFGKFNPYSKGNFKTFKKPEIL